jgi:hypothetical protein
MLRISGFLAPARAAVLALTAVLGLSATAPSAIAQEVQRSEGATNLRLDAVDPRNAQDGTFVFFASFLDKFRKPLEAFDPKEWTILMDGQPVGNPTAVKKLADSDQYINLVIILQSDSASDVEEFFKLTRDKAKKILGGLRATGDASVAITYGDTVDTSGNLSPSHNTAQNWLDERKPSGTTPAMLEAVQSGLRLFPSDFTSIGRNRAILIVGDGVDKNMESPSTVKDLTDQVKNEATKKRVHIHVISVPHENAQQADQQRIRKLADLTSGTYRAATSVPEVGNYMENFGAEVMGQHVLYFNTLDFTGDKDVQYKLELSHEGGKYPTPALTEKTARAEEQHRQVPDHRRRGARRTAPALHPDSPRLEHPAQSQARWRSSRPARRPAPARSATTPSRSTGRSASTARPCPTRAASRSPARAS